MIQEEEDYLVIILLSAATNEIKGDCKVMLICRGVSTSDMCRELPSSKATRRAHQSHVCKLNSFSTPIIYGQGHCFYIISSK